MNPGLGIRVNAMAIILLMGMIQPRARQLKRGTIKI